jgi:TonB family protein
MQEGPLVAIPAPAHDQSIRANDGGPAGLPRSPRVEVLAITSDDVLLEQIGQALDGESIIRPADSPAEARGIASPSQPCVVLLDARGYDDLARVVDDLQSPDGSRVIVIFAPADASNDVARALRGSATFAVLTIPVVQAQATAVLGGAREEALARRALLTAPPSRPASAAPDPASMPTADATTAAEAPTAASKRTRRALQATSGAASGRTKLIAASLGLLVLLVAAIAWYQLRKPATVAHDQSASQPAAAEPPADATEIVEPEALQTGSVDELLDSARAAMRARRYTDPEGQNALNYYRSVLAQEPNNGEAREGLERIAAVLHERVQSAVEERRFDEASRTLAQLKSIRPDDPAIARYEAAVVDARIRKALDGLDVERARELLKQATKTGALPPESVARWQSELDRHQTAAQGEKLADLVSLRIRQGKLLEPGNDSAKYYHNLLRRLPGDSRYAADATTELQQAYVAKLREALAKSQRADVERWKSEARALGVTAAEITALQRDVTARAAVAESKQDNSRMVQLIQERIADNKLLEPAADSAVFHLNALRALDPSAPAVATSERALSAKLLEQGRSALAEKRMDAARAHAAAARQLGVNVETVAALERDIAAAGTATGPVGPRPTPRLTRTRYVAPEYPAAALKQKVRGEVRLRITVDAAGRVSEAAVVQSNPPGVFDTVAVAAARKWRFKPIGEKDSGAEATVNVDIAFRPEDVQQ